jgi:hypothetical protein
MLVVQQCICTHAGGQCVYLRGRSEDMEEHGLGGGQWCMR